MSNNTPFFSLVIPCYNDGKYRAGQYLDRLLTSVVESNLDYNDIEVILADDHSPVSYQRVINKFKKYFYIKQIETEYKFAPGNTRQVGTMIAEGQWLVFADHDDEFYPRALRTVKDLIEASTDDPVYVYADFDKVADDSNAVVERFYKGANNAPCFVHGKFFNISKFWKAFHLHFPHDLRTHEDIALWSQVNCTRLIVDSSRYMCIPTPVYKWHDNPKSLSNTSYADNGTNSFFELFYSDYLESSIGQYIDVFESGLIDAMQLSAKVIPVFLNTWFEISRFKLNNPDNYIAENFEYVKRMWKRYRNDSKLSVNVIKLMMPADVVNKINSTAIYYSLDGLDTWISKLEE